MEPAQAATERPLHVQTNNGAVGFHDVYLISLAPIKSCPARFQDPPGHFKNYFKNEQRSCIFDEGVELKTTILDKVG